MASKEAQVYTMIEKKAGSNITMQGLSGMVGFPFTLVVDAGVIFTHYVPMFNEIRQVYGRNPVGKDFIMPILNSIKTELLADFVLDKMIGQIPIIGIATNMICAKAMTWRLGLLFGMLAARGEEVGLESSVNCIRLIRELFPQKNSLHYSKPSVVVVEKLLKNVEGVSQTTFDQKVMALLDGLEQA